MIAEITWASDRVDKNFIIAETVPKLYTPGERITSRQGLMRLGS